MVVNAKLDVPGKVTKLGREHTGGSHVGSDEEGVFGDFFHGQALQEPGKPGCYLGIFQNPGGFPQEPESPAQGGGAAQGVPVGPPVGEDQKPVMVPQEPGGFIPGQLHPAPPPVSR